MGIQNCCGTLAGAIAPALTGLMVEATGHFTVAFVTAALVSIAGLVGWVWMVPRLAPLEWPSPGTPAATEPARIRLR